MRAPSGFPDHENEAATLPEPQTRGLAIKSRGPITSRIQLDGLGTFSPTTAYA